MVPHNRRLARAALAFTLAIAVPSGILAQEMPHGHPPTETKPAPRGPEGRRLPPDSTTKQSVTLPDGRTLDFTATAGSLPLVDEAGKLQAEIAYVAYTMAPEAGRERPVTFAVNGGPGAASAYLNIGAIGPWRLPVGGDSISPSQPVALTPNDGTWLGFTDLVFIDPVGTGYSRAADGNGKAYWSIDSDASTLAAVIARYLRVNDRMASPKFFVGESYGGFRGPLIAEKLQEEIGVGLSGLVLLSPVLDFGSLETPRANPWGYVLKLPALAAGALERAGTVPTPALLGDAEAYASGPYLADLLKGPSDSAAVARMTEKVAPLVGLDPGLVRAQAARLSTRSVQREIDRAEGRVASAYDTGVTGWDPNPDAAQSSFEDPQLTALQAPLTSAMLDLYARTLKWPVPNMRYELLSNAVNRGWSWGSGRQAPEVLSNLKGALALDGHLQVLVAHGFTDLVTPYFASKLLLAQVPAYGAGRLNLAVYPGGHMFYTRPDSRAAFKADVERMYTETLKVRDGGSPRPAGAPAERLKTAP
ncbi:Carboxypeptidase C (cathepsin A) [Methylobacterium sp. UNC378MF]|uniref:S10 family peptidase n=1 Tax=Methylobacterium sp. UNC378MF TaxID=1502748 RepID=UPI00088A26E5|nr:peptidase S10 [Methylobacterium sp. UNC378MF]SDA17903.1 Carboxypeptidase C (cathepsin A) [Methylobacterium sp. UNC378MF]